MWDDLFQQGTVVPPGPGAVDVSGGGNADFMSMMQPMPDVQAANVPASSPQELEKRKSGWMQIVEKFSTNPNLQRAMMLMGAQMAQPLQPGQTWQGNAANSAVVGLNAYQLGQQAEFAQGQALRKEGREDTRLSMEGQRLGLEKERLDEQKKSGEVSRRGATAAARRGEVEADVAERTIDEVVASARTNRRKLELGLSEQEKDVALRDLTRDNEAIKAMAERPEIAARVRQEIELNDARLGQLQAGTRRAKAEAAQTEMTTSAINELSDADKRDWLLKRGKYGAGGQSALERHRDVYAQIWDALPADDARKKETKEQFVLRNLQSAKSQDAIKGLSDYLTAMDKVGQPPDPDIVTMLNEEIKARRGGSTAKPAEGAPKAAEKGAPKKKAAPPKAGQVVDGWKFKGGDPSKRENWEKVQ